MANWGTSEGYREVMKAEVGGEGPKEDSEPVMPREGIYVVEVLIETKRFGDIWHKVRGPFFSFLDKEAINKAEAKAEEVSIGDRWSDCPIRIIELASGIMELIRGW